MIKLTPRYFILFVALVNGVVFLVSLSASLLLLYRNATDLAENLESSKRNTTPHHVPRATIRSTADLSLETMEARKQKVDIVKVLKEKSQPRMPYPTKLSFRNEGKIKTFTDEN